MEPFRPARGVTLIELLVVLGIITVLMSMIMVSQSSFNKTLTLANTAYDVALTIRSTETLGLNSSNAGYGIHFSRGDKSSFLLFADTYPGSGALNLVCHPLPEGSDPYGPSARPGDCMYSAGDDSLVRTYAIGNGITVKDFCALQAGTWSCANSGYGGSPLSSLDIVFSRPSVKAFITVNGGQYRLIHPSYTAACVSFQSPQGGVRSISVSRSGEITGNSPSCPLP